MATTERTLTGLVTIAALAIGVAVTSRLPSADSIAAWPFVHQVAIGETVSLRTGQLTVDGVDATTAVTQSGKTVKTSAHWLLVMMRFTAAREPSALAGMTLKTADGRTYSATRPLQSTCGAGQPGITIRCTIPFEVPADALAGAHLLVPAALLGQGAGDDLADVDLGISTTRAAQLTAITEPKTVTGVTVVGSQPGGGS